MPSAMSFDQFYFTFDRPSVERCDFKDFLTHFSPEKLPTGPPLREMMGTFMFAIDGYNDDPRELNDIPEVRRFYSAFHQAWPYWIYFCDLKQLGLKMMVFSCLQDINSLKVDGQPNYTANYSPVEVLQFIVADFAHVNDGQDLAGSKRDIHKAVVVAIDRTGDLAHF